MKFKATVHIPLMISVRQEVTVEADTLEDAEEKIVLGEVEHCAYECADGSIGLLEHNARISIWEDCPEEISIEEIKQD